MTPNDPVADPTPDPWLQRFREIFAGALAVLVMTGFTIMIVIAVRHAGDSSGADQFPRIKDLLAIVTPLVGVVIGYYFSKTSTEARAEAAERANRAATGVARAAEAARADAEKKATQLAADGHRLFNAAGAYLAVTGQDHRVEDNGATRSRIELETAASHYGRAYTLAESN